MLTEQIDGKKAAFPRWLKWLVYGFIVLTCTLILLYALLASGLSNASLKSRMESGLSSWSGLRVQSYGGVTFGLFPPKATLARVKADSAIPAITIEADAVSVSFSLFSLMTQQPVMREIDVSGGQIIVDARKPLEFADFVSASTVGTAVEATKAVVGSDGNDQSGMTGTGIAPGVLRFRGTKLSVQWPGGRQDDVEELGGAFRWTSLKGAASLSASGTLNGESTRFEGTSAEPLKLLAGLESAVSMQFKADPVSFDYVGTLAHPSDLFAEGKLKVSAPSLSAVLAWMNVSAALPANQGALDLEANLSHADGKLMLNDLTMAFGGNPANGMLVFDPSLPTPLVSGTLAFEKADLGLLISAFQPSSQNISSDAALKGLDLDLRFSAETVQASVFVLTNAAGTIKISGNETLLDLGSSQLASGECIGSLKFSGPAGKREGVAKLSLRDVMADQLVDYGASFPTLSAPLSAQIEASGEFYNWIQFIRQAKGTLKLTVGEGVARNFSTETLAGLISGGAVFALTEAYAGLAPVVSGEVNAILSRGAAIISMADLQFTSHEVRLAGAVPLLSGGVALSGRIAPAGNQPDGLPFFVGGTWSRPFVTMGATGQ